MPWEIPHLASNHHQGDSVNPLTDILTPGLRKALYALLFVAGIVLGALKIAGVDTGAAAEVLAYVGAALGITAASNVTDNNGGPEVEGD